MSKWADYGISGVRFNPAHTHIELVQINKDNGESLGAGVVHRRADVVDAIKQGTTFVTVFRNSNQWNKGMPVFVIRVNGSEYLKTVDNGKAIDNLDNLPEI